MQFTELLFTIMVTYASVHFINLRTNHINKKELFNVINSIALHCNDGNTYIRNGRVSLIFLIQTNFSLPFSNLL